METLLATVDRVEQLRVPTIAAVTGGAIGGGLELALSCDIRIAAEDAFFVAAGVNVGLIMSTWRLPGLIGLGPAKAMLLTGEPCDAATALRTGLVREVVPADALLPAALATAHRIAGRSPLAVEATKAAVDRAVGQDRRTARAELVARCAELIRSRDHREAVRAFLQRRAPRFHRA
ncbi:MULTISPECIES: enoyl-CoA hydratase/isomerase family protein [Pseudonocardia]|uniref:enoyl-CoA hydratase/isomerase family protein n=1 Tax=Pseudonocardia TaxID=1847 RepID=UPI001E4C1A5A|nr:MULTISPECIES: enoyl-CoA hydratase-related protein [Pseudonocardia]